jgi:HPr kinase/phosphorylase
MLEIRGLGIRRLPYEPLAVVGLVIDLSSPDATRLPPQVAETTEISGVCLPRLALASGTPPLPIVLAALRTRPLSD